eukprot:CAMPEP_0203668758 /NCGR_PEP_ID=MMETSP0090-20130426/5309_1 /ASSEMBLY_ACC=CAM_ASM_001088 /TAXON_ID=426623 /ORGANISM="Chaetoceros affinis, Strain CCMP159" /LENGTH=900 /DNA_ID=CAMNT_0050533281 /DNA_START=173 /DNA_END=2875 /DNA_ORIENTATION=+
MLTSKISNADQECVSFLMTLKHRAVTPPAATTTATATATATATEAPLNQRRKVSLEGKNDTSSRSTDGNGNGSTNNNSNSSSSSNDSNNKNKTRPSLSPSSSSQGSFHYQAQTHTQTRVQPSSSSTCPSPRSSEVLTCLPIAMEDDIHFLSEYMCFVRSHCCEFFISDVNMSMGMNTNRSMNVNMNMNRNMNMYMGMGMNRNMIHRNQTQGQGQGQDHARGYSYNDRNNNSSQSQYDAVLSYGSGNNGRRNSSSSSNNSNSAMNSPMSMQVTAGRVGIRCRACRHTCASSPSTSFPSNISGIYGAVMMLICQHVTHCPMVSMEMRSRLEVLQREEQHQREGDDMNTHMNKNMTTNKYWIDAARSLGLYDTPDGIRIHHQSQQQQHNSSSALVQSSFFSPNINMKNSSPIPSNTTSCSPFQVQSDQNMVSRNNHHGNYCNTSTNNNPTPGNRNHNHNNVSYDCFDSVEEYHHFRATTNRPNANVTSSLPTTSNCTATTTPNANANTTTPRGKLTSALPNKVSPEVTSSNNSYHYHNSNDNGNNDNNNNRNNNHHNLHSAPAQTQQTAPKDEYSIEKIQQLMGDTKLVEMKDKDLVPDYLFLAMAQMKPCHLTDADRVGCYKEREVGFLGMSCKHCGGQPGFGKYFPATVRSLAQTTTSQTIVKHIAVKCRLCPPEVRLAVLALQMEQANKDRAVKDANGSAFESRPRYGSRKIFFNRLWGRLHGGDVPVVSRTNSGASDGTSSGSESGGGVGVASVSSSACPSSSNSMTAVGVTRSTSSTSDSDSNNMAAAAPLRRKSRSAVVSPHFEESSTCPTKFSYRWPPIARHMMKNQENTTDTTAVSAANDNHHKDMKQSNDFQQQRNVTMNPNEKRSRAVSYVDDERRHVDSYQRRKLNPMVSHY